MGLLLRDCQPSAFLNYIWLSSASVGESHKVPLRDLFALQEMSCLRYSSAPIVECSVTGQNVAKGGKFGLWKADEIESKLSISNINERISIKRIIVLM